jgi:transcriptional regulator with XRE-family HTH domain
VQMSRCPGKSMQAKRSLTESELATMDRIEAALKERGLSWYALALSMGLSRSAGGQWLTRRNFPRHSALVKIANELSMPLALLLGEAALEDPDVVRQKIADALGVPATALAPSERLSARETKLLAVFRDMSSVEQDALLVVAGALKGSLGRRPRRTEDRPRDG